MGFSFKVFSASSFSDVRSLNRYGWPFPNHFVKGCYSREIGHRASTDIAEVKDHTQLSAVSWGWNALNSLLCAIGDGEASELSHGAEIVSLVGKKEYLGSFRETPASRSKVNINQTLVMCSLEVHQKMTTSSR